MANTEVKTIRFTCDKCGAEAFVQTPVWESPKGWTRGRVYGCGMTGYTRDDKFPDVNPSNMSLFRALSQKARMIAGLHKQASFDNFRKWEAAKRDAQTVAADVDNLTKDNVALQRQNQAMQSEIDSSLRELGSLLAIILRDGGHYHAENGLFASIEKAKTDTLENHRKLNEAEVVVRERDALQSIARRAYMLVLGRLTPEQERQLGADLATWGKPSPLSPESEEARNLRKMTRTEG